MLNVYNRELRLATKDIALAERAQETKQLQKEQNQPKYVAKEKTALDNAAIDPLICRVTGGVGFYKCFKRSL